MNVSASTKSNSDIGTASSYEVSVILTTKNRVKDLERTCAVLQKLSPPPLEILITADGCTDGTVAFIKAEVPQARLFVSEKSRGSVAARDHMIREAKGELMLILDDDSYPQQQDCIKRMTPIFEQRPKLAVLHFPQCTDEYPDTLSGFDFGPARLTRTFSNAGAVIRRSIYLQLHGFEPIFFHAYEEPDYALQCVAAGYEVYYSPAVSIRHHYSGTARNEMWIHHRHARNEFWSVLMRCPFPLLLLLASYRVFSQFRYACSRGFNWALHEPVWWMQALAGIPQCLKMRKTVLWTDYEQWLRLPEITYPPEWPRSNDSPTAATSSDKSK